MPNPQVFVNRTAKVHPRGIVVMNYLEYSSEMLQDRSIYHSIVPVRYDPHDVSTIWVQAHGAWTECHSREFSRLKGIRVSTVKSAAKELRKMRKGVRMLGQKQLSELLNKPVKASPQAVVQPLPTS